jgi:hypothetical protein
MESVKTTSKNPGLEGTIKPNNTNNNNNNNNNIIIDTQHSHKQKKDGATKSLSQPEDAERHAEKRIDPVKRSPEHNFENA